MALQLRMPARAAAQNMKGYAALIEPSEFDWGEAKLSCHGRDSRAGIGVVARYEHGLPLPTMSVAWMLANPTITSVILGASQAEESSYESPKYGHGLFTFHLLDALNGRYSSLAMP